MVGGRFSIATSLEIFFMTSSNCNCFSKKILSPLLCFCTIQKYEKPPCVEEESEEEEEEIEDEDTTSAESDESEEEEEEEEEEVTIGNKGDKQNATRQDQLEWDDSTLPYQKPLVLLLLLYTPILCISASTPSWIYELIDRI